uniref:Predicted nucleotidyltransferase n=1 Tax=Candidatus Kentrum eta TaxID=2126337 RepID=A0A450UC62_9GAMM|nr:MAG: Predicted nucleotidyltransferase [Candidatus Kentron sp. H]VFJ90889.1 MAG: Predicted nucleotidyltransferase [Candidatus Kentron sp. H]VFJ97908.1 MAG: Predicted nucleotidyltransferase [Candidatus Kentron sp. H]
MTGATEKCRRARYLDIEPHHLDMVRDILHRHAPGCAVWAFGSRATGKARPYSDLDLAIITETPLPFAAADRLKAAFTESDLPWRVDIIDWATTSEAFRRIIERDRVVVMVAHEPRRARPKHPLRDVLGAAPRGQSLDIRRSNEPVRELELS